LTAKRTVGEHAAPYPGVTLADKSLTGARTLEEHRQFGEQLLGAGEALMACDALADGLSRHPGDVRLRQLLALGFARIGATRSANELLVQLWHDGHGDEETLGLLARTYKDLAHEAGSTAERTWNLQQAFQYYGQAYRSSGGYWTGINAATVALLLGDKTQAAALAREVRSRCLQAAQKGDGDAYWLAATLGEAALLLGDRVEAGARYAEAAALGKGRFGALASSRRNARLILEETGASAAFIDEYLPVPRVAVFSGHMVDAPGRAVPRFPPGLEAAVRAAIHSRLKALDVQFGFASAASGADLLFLEVLLELGGEAHVVLPYDRDQFVKDSVEPSAGESWVPRFERVVGLAAEVMTTSTQRMADGELSYEYALRLTDGMAGLRADELDTEVVRLAVWDGKPGDGPGGTGSAIDWWRGLNHFVEIIDLKAILESERGALAAGVGLDASPDPVTTVSDGAVSGFTPQIVGVLFADARHFSALTEEQILFFVEHFLGAVAGEVARASRPPILKNTWGDGLYFVFERVEDAGLLALALCDSIGRTDWTSRRLPSDLGLRVGLHAGPAYACTDPVTGRTNYLGVHVSRAARIEPITPPGFAYASGAFAALARAEQVRTFRCDYVGRTPLAKGYGTYPMYVVRRNNQ
jgi:Tetratricopeptide Repeats-Sensor